jgi:peptide/nickel transport system substrate-binding protein
MRAIGVKADEEGLLAFSAVKAAALDIEWMNYIGGPSLSILSDVLDDAIATGYVPFSDFEDLVTPEEAIARYQNLKDWYEEKNHFWVSSGPYYLDQADYVAHTAVLKANRDYPYKADRWDWLSAPPIPESDATVPDFVIPGLDASFTLDLSFGGSPYSNDRIDFVKYMVIDSAGELKTVGEAEPSTTEGQWTIDLEGAETDGLSTGSYNLVTIALSKDVAMPGTAETPFIVIPLVSYFQSILATAEAEFAMDIAELESTLEDTQGTTAEIQDSITDLQDAIDAIDIPTDVSGLADKISSLQTTTYLAIGAAIIAILIAAYAFMTKK